MIFSLFFFFNDTATTEIYTLSLHDALPISIQISRTRFVRRLVFRPDRTLRAGWRRVRSRSEEHTSELQSRFDLVCRLLLEKKKTSQSHTPRLKEHYTARCQTIETSILTTTC